LLLLYEKTNEKFETSDESARCGFLAVTVVVATRFQTKLRQRNENLT